MNEGARKSRWGKGIAASYLAFVACILAFVGFAAMQQYDLVDKDYYDKGVAYQSEIDRFTRTERLSVQPTVAYNAGSKSITIMFPSDLLKQEIAGVYHLMRPSDAMLDTTFALVIDTSGVQRIDASGIAKGLWRTELTWTTGGLDYSKEFMIVIE